MFLTEHRQLLNLPTSWPRPRSTHRHGGGQEGQGRGPAKSSAAQVQEALKLARSLYDAALDANFRFEAVDDAMTALKKVKVEDLKKVARELEIFSVPRKKDDIIAEIGRKIKGRREFHERTGTRLAERA